MSEASSTIPVVDPIVFLAGAWDVARDVRDDATGTAGTFVGTATFTPRGAGLDWVEHGCLTLGEYEGEASRTLRIVPDGAGWMVTFDDGRPFHPLDLGTGVTLVEHPCGRDHYVGGLRAESVDAVTIRWRVAGPKKDQTIVSRYTR